MTFAWNGPYIDLLHNNIQKRKAHRYKWYINIAQSFLMSLIYLFITWYNPLPSRPQCNHSRNRKYNIFLPYIWKINKLKYFHYGIMVYVANRLASMKLILTSIFLMCPNFCLLTDIWQIFANCQGLINISQDAYDERWPTFNEFTKTVYNVCLPSSTVCYTFP